jgi:hypothetical protein
VNTICCASASAFLQALIGRRLELGARQRLCVFLRQSGVQHDRVTVRIEHPVREQHHGVHAEASARDDERSRECEIRDLLDLETRGQLPRIVGSRVKCLDVDRKRLAR